MVILRLCHRVVLKLFPSATTTRALSLTLDHTGPLKAYFISRPHAWLMKTEKNRPHTLGSEQAVHTLTGTRDSPLLLYGFTALPLALARIAGGRGIEAGRGEREARAQGRGRKAPDMYIHMCNLDSKNAIS